MKWMQIDCEIASCSTALALLRTARLHRDQEDLALPRVSIILYVPTSTPAGAMLPVKFAVFMEGDNLVHLIFKMH